MAQLIILIVVLRWVAGMFPAHPVLACIIALAAKAAGTTRAGVKRLMTRAAPSTAPIDKSAPTITMRGSDVTSNCDRKKASRTALAPT